MSSDFQARTGENIEKGPDPNHLLLSLFQTWSDRIQNGNGMKWRTPIERRTVNERTLVEHLLWDLLKQRK
jgi:hypothetical protein